LFDYSNLVVVNLPGGVEIAKTKLDEPLPGQAERQIKADMADAKPHRLVGTVAFLLALAVLAVALGVFAFLRPRLYSVSELAKGPIDEFKGKKVRVFGVISHLIPYPPAVKEGSPEFRLRKSVVIREPGDASLDTVETVGHIPVTARMGDQVILEGIFQDRVDLGPVTTNKGIVVVLDKARVIE
jgi:hypothetical protein